MRSQPWTEGQARMEMTEPHNILRGKSSAPDRREMVLWTFGSYIRRWWQFLSFGKTFTFIRDSPYNSSLWFAFSWALISTLLTVSVPSRPGCPVLRLTGGFLPPLAREQKCFTVWCHFPHLERRNSACLEDFWDRSGLMCGSLLSV